MKTIRVILFSVLIFSGYGQAQGVYQIPIEGQQGVDWRIINYVDWGIDSSILDNHCLTKTYNGHQGTDFVLRSFKAMDEGINVVAVDSGVVIFTHDGEFDREKESVISKGLGNYIGITHSGDFQTYYGHLKKNSILVAEGDTVFAGQVLAQVASSGNSTDPHLHFELWYDSLYYIDPFSGPCGNATTVWQQQPTFDSSFSLWHSSFWNQLATLDALREEPIHVDSFYMDDAKISYWSLMHGIRSGDSLSLEWYTPSNSLWFQFDNTLDNDAWYYYYWSFIDFPMSGPFGEWSAKFYRNGILEDTKPFWILEKDSSDTTTHIQPAKTHTVNVSYQSEKVVITGQFMKDVNIYDMAGRQVQATHSSNSEIILTNSLQSGVYFIVIVHENNERSNAKIFIH